MRKLVYFAHVLLLTGCPDLVTVDDPRTVGSGGPRQDAPVEERGYCTGVVVQCEDRAQAQCNSGCTWAAACRSPDHERCASNLIESACDTDTACQWVANACWVKLGTSCDLDETQSACLNDVTETCVWGPACTGQTSCYATDTFATCNANLGCRWVRQ